MFFSILELNNLTINFIVQIAKLLLDKGADVNAIGGVLSSTPLHWAARHGHYGMVALLVVHGANTEIRDGEGFMALHIAAQFNNVPVVAYLITSGQSPNVKDSTNMTPLMWAAFKVPHPNPLQILLKLGADVNLVDGNFHNTALHYAVIAGNGYAVKELLNNLDVNINATNRQNETPLDIATQHNNLGMVRLLETGIRKRNLRPSNLKQRLMEDTVSLLFLNVIVFWCSGSQQKNYLWNSGIYPVFHHGYCISQG